MTRVALVLALAATLGTSCSFATKHPGVTVGITAGTVGFVTCGVAVEELKPCSIVGGIAALAIGGITGLVTTFFDTEDHTLPSDEEPIEPIRRVRGEKPPEGPYLPPEPNPLPQTALPDAGVPVIPVDAAADAPAP
jgi:hypothetical protein